MKEDNVIIDSEGKMLIIEHMYTVEDYFTFNIKVKSGEFSGSANFCMSKESLLVNVQALTEMHKQLRGCCEINDSDSDAHIMIETDKLGHVCIFGQIGGSHEDHFLKFKYTTDQTVLIDLVQMLKALL